MTRARPSGDTVVLFVGLAAGVVLRVAFARSSYSLLNSDEATAMLMVSAAAHGHFYAFFWGANYGGTLMIVVEAPLVRIFGLHVALFHVTNGLVTLGDSLLVLAIARRIVGYRAGVVACLLFWLLPPQWVRWSYMEYVWWTLGTATALATVLCCLRWSEVRTDARLWPIGFFAGLTLWMLPLYGCIVLPALVAVLWLERHRLVGLAKTVALAPLGALPWLYANLTHNFVSLHPQSRPILLPIGSRLIQAITVVLPNALLVHPATVSTRILVPLGWAIAVGAVLFAGWGFARRRWELGLCAVAVVFWPLFVALAGITTTPGSFRYAFVMLPALCIVIAFVLVRISWLFAIGALAIAVCWSAWAVGTDTSGFSGVARQERELARVVHFLERHARTHVYAPYWNAYPLVIASDGRVTASPTERYLNRVPSYAALAAHAPLSTYVFTAGGPQDTTMAFWLADHPEGRRFTVGDHAVYLMDRRVPPSRLVFLRKRPN